MIRLTSIKLNSILYFGIFFLTFLGYYAILLFTHNIGLDQLTRIITIPLRLVILLLIVILFISNRNAILKNKHAIWSLPFFAIYYVRLFIELVNDNGLYYMPISEVILYFTAFAVLPFLGLTSQKIKENHLKIIFKTFLIGGILFSGLALLSYGKFIGQYGRIASGVVGESVISPLALSYSSSLTIGVFLFYMMENKTSFKLKTFLLIGVALSVVPFFLGASRGSLFSLFIPFVFYFLSGRSVKFFLKSLVILILSFVLLIYIDTALKSDLLSRFLGISQSIQKNDATAIRVLIWKQSFQQFLNSPWFGGSLIVKYWSGYPHNLFLDVLQTTGIIGFALFNILLAKTFLICRKIFKHHKNIIWIAVIFIQAFMQSMFSGVIYTAVWLWTSMALIFGIDYYLKSKKMKEKCAI